MKKKTQKLLFVFIFSTYLPVVLLQFQVGALVGRGIQFRIQQVPTLRTFDGPLPTKNDILNIIFSGAGSIKSM